MGNMKLSTIYALVHPVTNEVRYIGKSVAPKTRFKTHCRAIGETRNARWIRTLRPLMPVMLELEVVLESEAFLAEVWWIAYCKFLGADLVNHTLGGEGAAGAVRSLKTRQLMSASISAAYRNPESRKRASESALRRWSDPSEKRAASETQQRIKRTPEARAMFSEIAKRVKSTPEARLNASLAATKALKKYYSSPESRVKASLRQKRTIQKMKDQRAAQAGQMQLFQMEVL